MVCGPHAQEIILVVAVLLGVLLIVIALQPAEFRIERSAASNLTTFKLTPDGDGTRVLWAMTGKNDFMGKGFSLFMDMDKMVGDDFENGLADLSKKAEAQASAAR